MSVPSGVTLLAELEGQYHRAHPNPDKPIEKPSVKKAEKVVGYANALLACSYALVCKDIDEIQAMFRARGLKIVVDE